MYEQGITFEGKVHSSYLKPKTDSGKRDPFLPEPRKVARTDGTELKGPYFSDPPQKVCFF